MRKRILSITLAVALVLALAPTGAMAADSGYNVLSYTLNEAGTEATITDCEEDATDEEVAAAFAEIAKNYTVIGIDDYAFIYCSLTSIIIPGGVTSIGYGAFSNCYNLTNITIPNGVTGIGDRAFSNCYNLIGITIPASVTNIGDEAFYFNHSLVTITVAPENAHYANDAYGVLFDREKTVLIQYPVGNTLREYAIPASVTNISDGAFYGSRLTAITVDSANAHYASDTAGVLFDKEKTVLVQYPTENARSDYAIPTGVISIGNYAFYRCFSLTDITIPAGVISIGDEAFENCDGLISITLPYGLASIGDLAFYDCDTLISITLPHGLASIGDLAFSGCTDLTGITLPAGLTSIGDWAFDRCIGLTSVTIPASLTDIGFRAFAYCYSLSEIIIADGTTDLSLDFLTEDTFQNNLRLYVPKSVISVGGSSSLDPPEDVTLSGKPIIYAAEGSFIAAWAAANLAPDRLQIIGQTPGEPSAKAIYILPGYMGSKLYTSDGEEYWADEDRLTFDIVEYILLGELNSIRKGVLRLDANGENSKVHADITTDSYGTENTYENLVEALKKDAEINSQYDIVFFPYNWLGDLNDSAKELENHINRNGYNSVVFVTHSTGGLLASAYIAGSRANKLKVEKAILIAAPLFGTYASLNPLETGEEELVTEKIKGALGDNDLINAYPLAAAYQWVRGAVHNSPTTYQLLPSAEYLRHQPVFYEMDDINSTLRTHFTNKKQKY
jgi:pimeloyl-ACP methyl ester carboxylesterase